MIIPLGDNLRIRGTDRCWQLEREITRKSVQDWQAFKYFGSLSSAIGGGCQREIRMHPADSLADAIRAADKIVARYARIFDEALGEIQSREAA